MRNALVSALVLLNAALAGAIASGGANAHSAGTYYPVTWSSNADVHYVMDNNVASDMRASLHAGLSNWDNLVAGRAPHFISDGEVTLSNDWKPCTDPSSIYTYEDIGTLVYGPSGSETVLGATQICVPPTTGISRITKFQITYERTAVWGGASGWYTGTGTPGGNQWDLRSIATHESGHATGFDGHFPESADACPNSSARNTMCPGNTSVLGTTWLRTLEDHDTHTIGYAY